MDDVMDRVRSIINNKKFRFIVKLLLVGLFIIFSVIIANKHEHWSDEAQSFLLARDTSFLEVFKYMKYEGTPPLWVLVIKIFIFLGGSYKTFFILPIIFNTIGLILFEYKIKAPWYIKLLFPFTYFIFFQYTIVARSYCLVFMMLMIIALIYKRRFDKPILYAFILFIFMNISLHTLMISGSFYLIYIIESIIEKKIKLKKIQWGLALMFVELLLTAIITYPAADCNFGRSTSQSFFHVLLEATIGSELNVILEIVLGIIIIGIFLITFKREKLVNLLILLLPISFVLMFIAFQIWHVGVIWLLLFSYFIISNQLNESKLIKYFTLLVCLVQGYWSISSVTYDYTNKYSASYDTAKYLEEYVDNDKLIYGFGYSKTAIQPYFKENIFDNRVTNKSFNIWKNGSEELYLLNSFDNGVDVYVISDFYKQYYLNLIKFLEYSGYERTEYKGATYIKDHVYESEGFIIYKKKSE